MFKQKNKINNYTLRNPDSYWTDNTVFNDYEVTSNTVCLHNELVLDALDLIFNVEHEDDLTSVLDDFGMSMSDFDPAILNAE